MAKHFMNKQRGQHMEGHESSDHGDAKGKSDIHIKSHSNGHTVHIMHPDGRHEAHEHESGDSEGISGHIAEHLGGGRDEEENENESNDVMDDVGGYSRGI